MVFFCLFTINFAFTAEKASSRHLRRQFGETVQELIQRNLLQGEWVLTDSAWYGEITIPVKSVQPEISAGTLFFRMDSLSGQLAFPYGRDNIDLDVNIAFYKDSLSGELGISGNTIQAEAQINSVRDYEGDYDLNLEVFIERLDLEGSLQRLIDSKSVLLQQLKHLTDLLKFEDLQMNVKADSSLYYRGMDLQCRASLEVQIRNPGFRQGQVTLQDGVIWKYGKKFQLSYGFYDCASWEAYAYGSYRTQAFLPSAESGYIRQDYLIILEFQYSPEDSVQWQLSSIPPLDNEEIVNLLVRGSPDLPEAAMADADNLEDRIKLAVQNYRSERYTRYAERQVGKLIAFDRVVIEGNVFNSGSVFRASKELGGKIELSVRGTVGGGAEQTVSFEYPLSERFFLVNETNQIGHTGVDIRYIVKYK